MKKILSITLFILLMTMPAFAGPRFIAADTTNLEGVESIQFDTSAGGSTHSEGLIEWNATAGTLDIHTDVTNTVIQVGQEMLIKVVNKTGSTIDNGDVVYISGAQGNRPSIDLAKADAEETSARTLGIATEDIADNAEGYITTIGLVRDIDTSSFVIGDQLFLSAATSGAIVNVTAPTSPDHEVFLGFCIVSNANNGVIWVSIDNGYEVGELHDMLITSVADNDIIAWNSSASVWENTADIIVNTVSAIGNGTQAIPSVGVGSDGNGLYSRDGVLGIIVANAEKFFVSGAAIQGAGAGSIFIRHADISMTTPVYAHVSDPDSGRWRKGSNNLEWVTGGVPVFNITNTSADGADSIMTIEGGIGPYGELWWHDDDGIGVGTDIDIATTPVFVNITSANINAGSSSNTTLTVADGSITVAKGGLYKINTTNSFTTSTGSAEVDHEVGVNGVTQDNCSAHRSIGVGGTNNVGNIGITCFLNLDAGDVVTMMVNSTASETIMYEAFNLNGSK